VVCGACNTISVDPIRQRTMPILPEKFSVSLRRTTDSIALTTTDVADRGVTRMAGENAYAPKFDSSPRANDSNPFVKRKLPTANLNS
jgi:hypothetical protein